MECCTILRKYFPRVGFGDPPPGTPAVLRAMLRNQTHNLIFQQRVDWDRAAAWLIAHPESNPARLAANIARRWKYPAYAFLRRLSPDLAPSVDAYDAYTGPSSQARAREEATAFEREMMAVMPRGTLTEADLKNMKHACTPDFLLPDGLWVEAKNWYACLNRFTMHVLRKQAVRYKKEFGPGKFVFRHGFEPRLAAKMPAGIEITSWEQFQKEIRSQKPRPLAGSLTSSTKMPR